MAYSTAFLLLVCALPVSFARLRGSNFLDESDLPPPKTEEERAQRLAELSATIDKDGDGSITVKELEAHMDGVAKKRLKKHAANHQKKNEGLFADHDLDTSRHLDRDEFNALINNHPPHFEYTFDDADLDKDGKVAKHELLKTMHPKPTYIDGTGIVSEMESFTVHGPNGEEVSVGPVLSLL